MTEVAEGQSATTQVDLSGICTLLEHFLLSFFCFTVNVWTQICPRVCIIYFPRWENKLIRTHSVKMNSLIMIYCSFCCAKWGHLNSAVAQFRMKFGSVVAVSFSVERNINVKKIVPVIVVKKCKHSMMADWSELLQLVYAAVKRATKRKKKQ